MKGKLVAFLLTGALALWGCESEGPAEKAGERIDEAVESASEKVEEAADEVGNTIEEAGDKVREKTN